MHRDYTSKPANRREKVEVEVLFDSFFESSIIVRTDEDSAPITLPRSGVSIRRSGPGVATLLLSEHKAIAYNLI